MKESGEVIRKIIATKERVMKTDQENFLQWKKKRPPK